MKIYFILYYSSYKRALVYPKEFTDLAMYSYFAQKSIYYLYLSKINIEYFDNIYKA